MGLSSVLVDRGRVWTNTQRWTTASPGHPAVPMKVEGSSVFEWQPGEWFACRVNAPAAPETPDSANGRIRSAEKPTLIFDLEDEAGGTVVIHADSRVEVDSEELGRYTYEVTGEPEIYRKKSSLVAGEAQIMRLEDPWPAGKPHSGTATVTVLAGASETVVEPGQATVTITPSGTGSVA